MRSILIAAAAAALLAGCSKYDAKAHSQWCYLLHSDLTQASIHAHVACMQDPGNVRKFTSGGI